MFIPKLFQWKSKDSSFKCVGTNDVDDSNSDWDSTESYLSFSNINNEVENIEQMCHMIKSNLAIVKNVKPFPDCCTNHLIELSYRNFEKPSKQEMMNRRLELYFKKYSCGLNEKDFNNIIMQSSTAGPQEHEKFIKEESVKVIKSHNSVKVIKLRCLKTEKIQACYQICTTPKIEKPIRTLQIINYNKTIGNFKNHDLQSCDTRISGHLSRNLSRVTTRSSQDIFYTARSNNFTNEEISFDNKTQSEKSLKSFPTSSFTTCLNTSSKSVCEEIEKLNLNSNNSVTEEIFDSSRISMNSTMTSCYNDNSFTLKLKNYINNERNSPELDHVTSFTEGCNIFSSERDFTKITEIIINPISEFTVVSSMKSALKNKPKKNKNYYNKIFEKYLSIIKCGFTTDVSSIESSEWSLSHYSKSASSNMSKLPRKSKKSSSTYVSDLGSFDLYTYLSSFDKSESCIN